MSLILNLIAIIQNRWYIFNCLNFTVVCFEQLGVANGLIPDDAITASSSLDDSLRPYYGRVLKASSSKTASRGCWCARKSDTAQYLQVDLQRSMTLTGMYIYIYIYIQLIQESLSSQTLNIKL